MSASPVPEAPAMATGLPPGWIELAAFDGETTLRAFLDAQLDVDAELFSPEHRDLLVDGCLLAHSMLSGQRWLHLGAVATWLPIDDTQMRTTVWTVGVGLLSIPQLGDIHPIGVAERVLGRRGDVQQVEPFQLPDGRDGVVIGATTSFDVAELSFDPTAYMPQLRPDELGVYIVLLPVVDLPDHLGVTVGVAPNLDERGPMSVLASQMAVSLQRLDRAGDVPPDYVLVDSTRTIHPSGFLTGPLDPTAQPKEQDVATADL